MSNEEAMDKLGRLIYARDGEIFWTEDESEADSFEGHLIKNNIKYTSFIDGFKHGGTKFSFEIL